MSGHLEFQIKLSDLCVEHALKRQVNDPASEAYGAVISAARGYYGGESGTYIARDFIVGYYLEGSRYYRDDHLLAAAGRAMEFALRQQKPDGTFDLKETNFHDAAQTAFIVSNIGPAILLMRDKSRHTPQEDALYELLLRFINRAADGMIAGGFHTPNHRWVLSGALAICNALTGRQDCLDKMKRFLNEGIDQDEEGEYTERSNGMYNIVCDRSFIFLAFVGGMNEMYDIVAKNLRLVTKYFEPDMTVNTANSTRVDAGTMPDWRIYYGLYLFMALRTGDKEFRYIADRMLKQSESRLSPAGISAGEGFVPSFEYLPFVLMDDSLKNEWDAGDTVPFNESYEKLFENSGIARVRKDNFSLTLIKENPDFALMKFGRHGVKLRLAGTFYAQGQFAASEMEKDGDEYVMTYRRRWGYKSPLPERQDTSDWRRMDHSKREDVFMQDFVFEVRIKPLASGAEIHVKTQGVESVLTKLEILLEPNGCYYNDAVFLCAKSGDYIIQGADRATYEYVDGVKLNIRGGRMKHYYAEHMRGSLMGEANFFTVAMTDDTPMDDVFRLEFMD